MSRKQWVGKIVVGIAWIVMVLLAVYTIAGVLFPGEKVQERPLVFVIIPAESPVASREHFDPFVAYLNEHLSREVKLMLATDYTAVVEAMKYGWADVARLGPNGYVLATEQTEMFAIVKAIKKKTGRPEYRSLIITKPGSGVVKPEDLNGQTFAFVDVGSTSGYLVPNFYIEETGIELGRILFAGAHDTVIEAVRNGAVSAGAMTAEAPRS